MKFVGNINAVQLNCYPQAFSIDREKNLCKIEILGKNEFGLHGLWLNVLGLDQIPENAKIKTGEIIKQGNEFFINVCFESLVDYKNKFELVGVDLGLKNQLTLSDGTKISYEPLIRKITHLENRLKKSQHKLSKKIKRSKNFFKQKDKVNKIHQKIMSLKNDNRHRLVSVFMDAGVLPVFQNDNLRGWQRLWGKKISQISLSKIRESFVRIAKESGLKYETISQWEATTKTCNQCSHKKDEIGLDERVFFCDNCSLELDRDINAAINILNGVLKQIPANSGEFTPVESSTSALLLDRLREIPNITVSSGSLNQESPYRALINS